MLLIIPTLNAGRRWTSFIQAVQAQSIDPDWSFRVLIVDSGSTDNTVSLSKEAGWEVHQISSHNFDHGGTRQEALQYASDQDEIVIFMTQDAICSDPFSLKELIQPLEDKRVALVYGQQLPHPEATPLSILARQFNYPDEAVRKTQADRTRLGLKAPFCSNSFAAYRLSTLKEVGGFSTHLILGEDMLMAAKLLQAGYTVCYEPKARVYHSHNYSLVEEIKRYFDTGVFHCEERETLKEYGGVKREGIRFLKAQFSLASEMLGIQKYRFLFEVILRNALKYLAYQLGRHHQWIPLSIKRRLSMFKAHWQ